jgi:hypothetical protein
MTSEPSMVTLRDGTQIAEPALRAMMINLEDFSQAEPIAFYELAELCRDPGHVLFGNTGGKLAARGFLDGAGHIQTTVQHVLLSALRGEDGGLYLGSPVAGQP